MKCTLVLFLQEKKLEKKLSESKTTTTPGKASNDKLSSYSHTPGKSSSEKLSSCTPDHKTQAGSGLQNTPKSVMSQDSQSSQKTASPQVGGYTSQSSGGFVI